MQCKITKMIKKRGVGFLNKPTPFFKPYTTHFNYFFKKIIIITD